MQPSRTSFFIQVYMCALSLQGVPSVTDVGHCGFKSCTRDTLLPIFRSFGGRTTAGSYREDTFSSTIYNSVVTYTCDVGYTLQGSNSRTCQSNGQWSGSVPQYQRMLYHVFMVYSLVNTCLLCIILYAHGQPMDCTYLFHTAFQSNPHHRCKCQELCRSLHLDTGWCRQLHSKKNRCH